MQEESYLGGERVRRGGGHVAKVQVIVRFYAYFGMVDSQTPISFYLGKQITQK